MLGRLVKSNVKIKPAIKGISVIKGELFYFPLPKSACTSIKLSIYRLQQGRSFDINDLPSAPMTVGSLLRLAIYKLRSEGTFYSQGRPVDRHIHDYFERRLVVPEKEQIRVLVVRDPIKRFLSAFGNRVKFHGELHERAIFNNAKELIDSLPYFNPTLVQFVEHFDVYNKVPSIAHHCKSVASWVNNDLEEFTDIIPIENVSEFEVLLSDKFNQTVSFPREQSGGRKIPVQWLTKKHLTKLLALYADDYVLLAGFYSPETIIKEWENGKRSYYHSD